MKRLMLDAEYGPTREFCAIRGGWLEGCELLLSQRDRFPLQAGIYEREIGNRFTELARRARVFADVGAAEGFFSIYMLRHTEAEVIAFESTDDFGDLLQQNLGRHPGCEGRVVYNGNPLTGRRKWNTIDRFLAGRDGPFLLKIDACGEEVEVLEGAAGVLDESDTAAVIKVRDSPTEERCLRLLNESGFQVEILGPAWWRRAIGRDCGDSEISHWLVAEKN